MEGADMIECSVCHSKVSANNNNSKAVVRAYDRHRSDVSSKTRFLNLFLVVGDCILVGLQVIFFLSFSFVWNTGKIVLLNFCYCYAAANIGVYVKEGWEIRV